MNKIKVQLVKYDLTKTKNRKRQDLLVDSRHDDAVIAQLERIHKGEQVVKIHEIVWADQKIEVEREYTTGTVKFMDLQKGFGFIAPDEDMDDLFFHITACPDGAPTDRDRVEFQVSEGPKGLVAIQVRTLV